MFDEQGGLPVDCRQLAESLIDRDSLKTRLLRNRSGSGFTVRGNTDRGAGALEPFQLSQKIEKYRRCQDRHACNPFGSVRRVFERKAFQVHAVDARNS